MAEVERPPTANDTVPLTARWWQPLIPVPTVDDHLNTTPPGPRQYIVRFEPGPHRGDCIPWGIAVLIYYLHGVLVTVKEVRGSAQALLRQGVGTQADLTRLTNTLLTLGLPEGVNPLLILEDYRQQKGNDTKLGLWGLPLEDAVALTEREVAGGGESLEMTGLLGILAYAHLGTSLGWATPTIPSSPPSAVVPIVEMEVRELQDSPHPFTRLGQELQPGGRKAYLVTNNVQHVPIIVAQPPDGPSSSSVLYLPPLPPCGDCGCACQPPKHTCPHTSPLQQP